MALTVLAAVGWLIAVWPRSPSWAVMGAAALLVGHAWFLAAELLLLPHVARNDPAPLASRRQRLAAWAAETRVALQVFAWRQPFRWRSEADCLDDARGAGRTGVVLVHGFLCNRGFWRPWLRRLRADGRAFVAVNLEPPFASIDDYAPAIHEAVHRVRRATGRPPLLVCHSMGGLAARAWLVSCGHAPAGLVRHVVTIATPHRGTWLARFSRRENGRQMSPDSAWLASLHAATPCSAAAHFTCWWSNCDNVVMPPSMATLEGADNRLLPGAAHVDLAFRPEVMEATFALLEQAAE
ncbi:alpha/beta fold hydrolase [Ramlibacter sp. AN1015]|uniref:esterase/lipase family protein n=1 Tax=Ramlibacter sp. AN1015 TaxID=3133428 RepID=UPI0030C47C8B